MDNYVYTQPETSYFYKWIMSPLCGKLVEYVPKSISPNILTLTGLLCSLVSMFIVSFDMKNYNWLAAILWICYNILDNMDGKHARNTNQSSLLGEICDHVCDAYSTMFMYIITLHTMNIPSYLYVFWFLLITTTFYLDHWQSYYTRKLVSGNAYFGTDEINIINAVSIFLWGYGVNIWWGPVLFITISQLFLFCKDHVLPHLLSNVNSSSSLNIYLCFIMFTYATFSQINIMSQPVFFPFFSSMWLFPCIVTFTILRKYYITVLLDYQYLLIIFCICMGIGAPFSVILLYYFVSYKLLYGEINNGLNY